MNVEKIKEVHDYFKNKIINGDYIVTKKTKYTWTVFLDDTYVFTLWICSGPRNFKCYQSDFNFMDLKFNLKESTKGFKFIEKLIIEHEKNVLKLERKKEYENLKKEFEPVKS